MARKRTIDSGAATQGTGATTTAAQGAAATTTATQGAAAQTTGQINKELNAVEQLQQVALQAGQDSAAAIQAATELALNDFDETTNEQISQMQEQNAALEAQGQSLMDRISGWERGVAEQAERRRRESELQAQNDYRTRVFGGIAEAAANLVNIFGTVAGANNQKYQSAQPTWAQRADAAARERENKLMQLRDKQRALQQQLAEVRYNFGRDKANRASQLAQLKAKRADERAGIVNAAALSRQKALDDANQRALDIGLYGLKAQQAAQEAERDRAVSYANMALRRELNAAGGGDNTGRRRISLEEFQGVRDRQAQQAGYANYNDYLKFASAKDRRTRREFQRRSEENPDAHRTLRTLRNPETLTDEQLELLRISQPFDDAVNGVDRYFND